MEWENKMHSFNLSAAVLERCVTRCCRRQERNSQDDHLVHVYIYSMEKQHMRIQNTCCVSGPIVYLKQGVSEDIMLHFRTAFSSKIHLQCALKY